MLKVLNCITVQHDWRLVLIAALVCTLISFEAVAMFRRGKESDSLRKWLWVAAASFVTGAGVWATHFIAMLAYEYQIERGIDGLLTLGSGLAGILLAAAAYTLALQKSRLISVIGAGIFMGASISTLHYTGMAAYGVAALLQWDMAYVFASVAVSMVFGIAMFWGIDRRSILATVAMILAIVLLHFTGMTALTVIPTTLLDSSALIVDREIVTLSVMIVTGAMVLLGMAVLAIDSKLLHEKAQDADRLKALNERLEAALVHAESSARAKSDFLANMSHEIRTPMNGIIGMTEILMNTDLDERQAEYANLVLSSANGLMTVLNDILDFSKLESGKMKLQLAGFNLRRLLGEVVATMQARASAQDVELILRYAPSLPDGVIGDEGRIRQIVSNLVGNAVKFTRKGHVFVNVDGQRDADGVSLVIEIEDTGIGIAEEQLEHIFEKFEQADTSRSRNYEGTGLGLAISQELVNLMEGTIGVRSVLNEGSTFWVKLHLPQDDSVSALAVAEQGLFDKQRVLAVDDNPVNRRILTELFSGWGIQATVVSSARDAFMAAEQAHTHGTPFDLLLTDYHMPEENGDQLTQRLQADDRFRDLACMLLTSVDVNSQPGTECVAHYAASITKPIRASRLMDNIMRVLSEASVDRLQQIASVTGTTEKPQPVQAGDAYILVAEDNVVNQQVIKAFLAETGLKIAVVGNGRDAVAEYLKASPALIFMDVSMPVMDGLSASQEIRRIETAENRRHVPIIAATAHVLEQDRKACFEAGMDDFISKPIRKPAVDMVLQKWEAHTDGQKAALAE